MPARLGKGAPDLGAPKLAADLEEAVDFYDTRFNIGLTGRERADLVAFLNAL